MKLIKRNLDDLIIYALDEDSKSLEIKDGSIFVDGMEFLRIGEINEEDFTLIEETQTSLPDNFILGYYHYTNGQFIENNMVGNQWEEVKKIRNSKLSECDWTQVSDCPLTEEKKQEWASYRQELRDITLSKNPFAIEWPRYPGEVRIGDF